MVAIRSARRSLKSTALVDAPTLRPLLIVLGANGRPHVAQLTSAADTWEVGGGRAADRGAV